MRIFRNIFLIFLSLFAFSVSAFAQETISGITGNWADVVSPNVLDNKIKINNGVIILDSNASIDEIELDGFLYLNNNLLTNQDVSKKIALTGKGNIFVNKQSQLEKFDFSNFEGIVTFESDCSISGKNWQFNNIDVKANVEFTDGFLIVYNQTNIDSGELSVKNSASFANLNISNSASFAGDGAVDINGNLTNNGSANFGSIVRFQSNESEQRIRLNGVSNFGEIEVATPHLDIQNTGTYTFTGSLIVESGDLELSDIDITAETMTISSGSKLILNSGDFTNNVSNINVEGELILNGGLFAANLNLNGGSFVLNGGKIIGQLTDSQKSSLTINDGILESSNVNLDQSIINIAGGSIIADGIYKVNSNQSSVTGGKLIYSGSEFSNNVAIYDLEYTGVLNTDLVIINDAKFFSDIINKVEVGGNLEGNIFGDVTLNGSDKTFKASSAKSIVINGNTSLQSDLVVENLEINNSILDCGEYTITVLKNATINNGEQKGNLTFGNPSNTATHNINGAYAKFGNIFQNYGHIQLNCDVECENYKFSNNFLPAASDFKPFSNSKVLKCDLNTHVITINNYSDLGVTQTIPSSASAKIGYAFFDNPQEIYAAAVVMPTNPTGGQTVFPLGNGVEYTPLIVNNSNVQNTLKVGVVGDLLKYLTTSSMSLYWHIENQSSKKSETSFQYTVDGYRTYKNLTPIYFYIGGKNLESVNGVHTAFDGNKLSKFHYTFNFDNIISCELSAGSKASNKLYLYYISTELKNGDVNVNGNNNNWKSIHDNSNGKPGSDDIAQIEVLETNDVPLTVYIPQPSTLSCVKLIFSSTENNLATLELRGDSKLEAGGKPTIIEGVGKIRFLGGSWITLPAKIKGNQYQNFDSNDRSVWELYADGEASSAFTLDFGDINHDNIPFPNLNLIKQKTKGIAYPIVVRKKLYLENTTLVVNKDVTCNDLELNNSTIEFKNGATLTVYGNITLNKSSLKHNSGTNLIKLGGDLVTVGGTSSVNLHTGCTSYTQLEIFGSQDNVCNIEKPNLYQIIMNKDEGKKFEFQNNVNFSGCTDVAYKPLVMNQGNLILNNTSELLLSRGGSDFLIGEKANLIINNTEATKITNSNLQLLGGLTANTEFTAKNITYGASNNSVLNVNNNFVVEENILPYGSAGNLHLNISSNLLVNKDFNLTENCVLKMSENSVLKLEGNNKSVKFDNQFMNLNANSKVVFNNANPTSLSVKEHLQNIELNNSEVTTASELNISGNVSCDNSTLNSQQVNLSGNLVMNASSEFNANTLYFVGKENQTANLSNGYNVENTLVNKDKNLQMSGDASLKNLELIKGILDVQNIIKVTGDYVNNSSCIGNGLEITLGEKQKISGVGSTANLVINNDKGVTLENSTLTITQNLTLTSGILFANTNKVILEEDAIITGGSNSNYIDFKEGELAFGLSKYFGNNQNIFVFPIGNGGKYTPVYVKSSAINQGDFVTIKPYNAVIGAVSKQEDIEKTMPYFWQVQTSVVDNSANLTFSHQEDFDAQIVGYLQTTKWAHSGDVDGKNLNFTNLGNGYYTAFTEEVGDIMVYETTKDGYYSDSNLWKYYDEENDQWIYCDKPVDGSKIIVKHDIIANEAIQQFIVEFEDEGSINLNGISSSKATQVNGKGTIYQINTGVLFVGANYEDFVKPGNGTLVFEASNMTAALSTSFNQVNNIVLKGNSEIVFPNNDMTINGDFTIEGIKLLYGDYTIDLNGDFIFNGGSFSNDKLNCLKLSGDQKQFITGKLSNNPDNSLIKTLIVNNNQGVELNKNLYIEKLNALNGVVYTNDNSILYITNNESDCINNTAKVDGSLAIKFQNSSEFTFPLCNDGRDGKVKVTSVTDKQNYIIAKYYNKSQNFGFDCDDKVSYPTDSEYWTFRTSAGTIAANLQLFTDANSNLCDPIKDTKAIKFANNIWNILPSSFTGDESNGSVLLTSKVNLTSSNVPFTFTQTAPEFNEWLGVDSNWENSENWSLKTVPQESDKVRINKVDSNIYPILQDGGLVKVSSIIIEKDAKVTIKEDNHFEATENANIVGKIILTSSDGRSRLGTFICPNTVGNVSVTRAFNGGQWYRIATPFANISSSKFTWAKGYYNGNLLKFDENIDINSSDFDALLNDENADESDRISNALSLGWQYLAMRKTNPAVAMNPTIGYDYYAFDKHSVTLEGNPNLDNHTISLNYSGNHDSKTDDFYGWNCIGNPFTANLDWDQVTVEGGENAVYIMDMDKSNDKAEGDKKVNYVVYSNGHQVPQSITGTADARYIPMMQSVFVHATEQNAKLIISKEAATHNTGVAYNSGSKKFGKTENIIRLKTVSKASDEVLMYSNDLATIDFDAKFDAYKMFSQSENVVEMYICGSKKMCINSFDLGEKTQTIKLGYKLIGSEQNAKITCPEFDLVDCRAVFVDKLLDKKIYLTSDFEYEFVAKVGDVDNRFEIVFYPNNAPRLSNPISDVVIYQNQKMIVDLPNDMFVDTDYKDEVENIFASNLPEFVKFEDNKFILKPTNQDLGAYDITIFASDKFSALASANFRISVIAPQSQNIDSKAELEANNSQNTLDIAVDLDINVYPNPVVDKVNIAISGEFNKAKMQIVDSFGKILVRKNLYQNHSQEDFSSFKQGIYLLKVEVDGLTKVFKLVK